METFSKKESFISLLLQSIYLVLFKASNWLGSIFFERDCTSSWLSFWKGSAGCGLISLLGTFGIVGSLPPGESLLSPNPYWFFLSLIARQTRRGGIEEERNYSPSALSPTFWLSFRKREGESDKWRIWWGDSFSQDPSMTVIDTRKKSKSHELKLYNRASSSALSRQKVLFPFWIIWSIEASWSRNVGN